MRDRFDEGFRHQYRIQIGQYDLANDAGINQIERNIRGFDAVFKGNDRLLGGRLFRDGVVRADLIQPGEENDLEVFERVEVGMINRHTQLRLGIFLFVLDPDFHQKRGQIIR